MSIGENIKKVRIEKGKTQKEIAENCGVARVTVTYWETDRRQPTLFNAICLADVLDVTLDYLVGRE